MLQLFDLFQRIWDWVLLTKSHNSFFESDELLLLLLPALKVSVDQRLQLIKVFVLTFLLDVLLEVMRRQISLTDRINVFTSQPTRINTTWLLKGKRKHYEHGFKQIQSS